MNKQILSYIIIGITAAIAGVSVSTLNLSTLQMLTLAAGLGLAGAAAIVFVRNN
ncbi:hypothetical protein N7931_14905 [Catenovulum sp. 2E275]|uniref:hypothetical protein n=1 Tax=Catenovulum sp. 2E275 TaxID=2980497 RepID=UPI0021D297CC|nr:hypothetical protein [Catenovulum sp. 2E275]MCU4676921.1 hypothetical protein [Catenovulum sp. 2E275]